MQRTPPPSEKNEDPGELVGTLFSERYRVTGVVGRGGMSVVYRALHTRLNKVVALKVLSKGYARDDKSVLRFIQEAKASNRLNHPSIIRVFDYGQSGDGHLFISMELLEGEPLSRVVALGGPLMPARACQIMRKACDALAAAHNAGIIHRDLKPDNIFLLSHPDEPDAVKLLDFGIAKVTGDTDYETLTQTGYICGTPLYISPEQSLGMELDGRTDLYSVGVILFELLTGRTPFVADTPIALVMKHIHNDPPRLEHVNPQARIPGELAALVYALLAKDRQHRPETATEVRLRLQEIAGRLEGEPSFQNTEPEMPAFMREDGVIDAQPAGDATNTEAPVALEPDEEAPSPEDPTVAFAPGSAPIQPPPIRSRPPRPGLLRKEPRTAGAPAVKPMGKIPTGRTGPGIGTWVGAALAVLALGFVGLVVSRTGGVDPLQAPKEAPPAARADTPVPAPAKEVERHGAEPMPEGGTEQAEAHAEHPGAAPSAQAPPEGPAHGRPTTPAPRSSPLVAAADRRPRRTPDMEAEAAAPAAAQAPRAFLVESTPGGALVVIRGKAVGQTPFRFEAGPDTPETTLIVSMDGYLPESWRYRPGAAPPPGQDRVRLALRAAKTATAQPETAKKPKRPKKPKVVWE